MRRPQPITTCVYVLEMDHTRTVSVYTVCRMTQVQLWALGGCHWPLPSPMPDKEPQEVTGDPCLLHGGISCAHVVPTTC